MYNLILLSTVWTLVLNIREMLKDESEKLVDFDIMYPKEYAYVIRVSLF